MTNCTRYLSLDVHIETITAALASFPTVPRPFASSSSGWVAPDG
jgi:hypothetical protein